MLSQLAREFFARSPVLAWPVFALALFSCVFIAVTLKALLARREDVQRLAALPLSDAEEKADHV
jgi:hypothetical protein